MMLWRSLQRSVRRGPGVLLAWLLWAPALLAGGDVWVVVSGPLQPVVDGAADGDTILIRSGDYDAFVIDGKSLSVIEDQGSNAAIFRLEVRNLGPGQWVRLCGLTFESQVSDAGPMLHLHDNQGTVSVEDADTNTINDMLLFSVPSASVLVDNCSGVSFVRSSILGRHNDNPLLPAFGPGAPGVEARNSSISLHNSQVLGRGGRKFCDTPGGAFFCTVSDGGPAIRLESSALFASGTLVRGGAGPDGGYDSYTGSCFGPGDGGPGISVLGLREGIRLQETQVLGGAGGTPPPGSPCGSGQDAPPIDPPDVQPIIVPGQARPLELTALLREGQAGLLRITGPPGASVLLLGSPAPGWLDLPGRNGILLGSLPFGFSLGLGSLPPSGELLLPFTAPALPPACESRLLMLQGVFLEPGGATLGDGAGLMVLDSVF